MDSENSMGLEDILKKAKNPMDQQKGKFLKKQDYLLDHLESGCYYYLLTLEIYQALRFSFLLPIILEVK